MPLTDEQIRRHREQRAQRDQWRADVAALENIVDKLRTQYAQHKGDFAVGRYEELKVRQWTWGRDPCQRAKPNTVSQKSSIRTKLMAITLSILNGFSKFFHSWKEN